MVSYVGVSLFPLAHHRSPKRQARDARRRRALCLSLSLSVALSVSLSLCVSLSVRSTLSCQVRINISLLLFLFCCLCSRVQLLHIALSLSCCFCASAVWISFFFFLFLVFSVCVCLMCVVYIWFCDVLFSLSFFSVTGTAAWKVWAKNQVGLASIIASSVCFFRRINVGLNIILKMLNKDAYAEPQTKIFLWGY